MAEQVAALPILNSHVHLRRRARQIEPARLQPFLTSPPKGNLLFLRLGMPKGEIVRDWSAHNTRLVALIEQRALDRE